MSDWFDKPSTKPRRRRPFEELITELAERTGRPLWRVDPEIPSGATARRRWPRK